MALVKGIESGGKKASHSESAGSGLAEETLYHEGYGIVEGEAERLGQSFADQDLVRAELVGALAGFLPDQSDCCLLTWVDPAQEYRGAMATGENQRLGLEAWREAGNPGGGQGRGNGPGVCQGQQTSLVSVKTGGVDLNDSGIEVERTLHHFLVQAGY